VADHLHLRAPAADPAHDGARLRPDGENTLNIIPFQNSARIGLQFKRRFWEDDDRIFGGISWTNQPINEIYYPSHGFFQPKGVFIGYYMFGPPSDEVTRLAPRRIECALSRARDYTAIPRRIRQRLFRQLEQVPHIKRLSHFRKSSRRRSTRFSSNPTATCHLAGDWASHLGGWQAGAFESARHVVKNIHAKVAATCRSRLSLLSFALLATGTLAALFAEDSPAKSAPSPERDAALPCRRQRCGDREGRQRDLHRAVPCMPGAEQAKGDSPSNLFDTKWYHGSCRADRAHGAYRLPREKHAALGRSSPAEDTTAVVAFILSQQKSGRSSFHETSPPLSSHTFPGRAAGPRRPAG